MREVKKDIIYILKRVIIGVLTAIILFNVSKCNVYAETVKHLTLNTKSSNTVLSFSDESKENSRNLGEIKLYNNSYTLKLDTIYDDTTYYNVFYNSENNDYFIHFFTPKQEQIDIINNSKGLIIDYNKSGTNNNPIYYYNSSNIYALSSDNELIDGFEFSNLSKTVLNNSDFPNSIVNRIYIENGELKKQHISSQISYGTYITEDYNLISSSFNKDIYYYNRYKSSFVFKKYSSFPPTGYSELNLLGYEGVIFTPKDYSNIETSEIGDLYTSDFEYYYEGAVREATFPLDDHLNITFNSDTLYSLEPSFKSSYITFMRNDNDKKTYYGLIIYNDILNAPMSSTGSISVTLSSVKIWYNSNLYNYYLVKDYNTYSENITFKDGNEEKNVKVEGLPTLKDAVISSETQEEWDDIFNNNSDNTTTNKNNNILNFLKLPFSFLNSVSPNNCKSITLTIPYVNKNITLNCFLDTFKNVLGSSLHIISLTINVYIMYKVTLSNIKAFTKMLDPLNIKLEEVDL